MAKNSSIQNVMEVMMASSDKNDLSRKAEMLKNMTRMMKKSMRRYPVPMLALWSFF